MVHVFGTRPLFFWFILDDELAGVLKIDRKVQLKKWLDLVPASGRFRSVDGQIGSLEDLTAKDYVDSDRLDLDHLSSTDEVSQGSTAD